MAIVKVEMATADNIAGQVFAALVGTGMILDATECHSNPREAVAKLLQERIQELFESERRRYSIMDKIL